MGVQVKICGIKSVEDALNAITFGADRIGLLMGQAFASADFISTELAQKIFEEIPSQAHVVLVTHYSEALPICQLLEKFPFSSVQLHNTILEKEVKKIIDIFPEIKLVKAIPITNNEEGTFSFKKMVGINEYLTDTVSMESNQIGGTGLTHDWRLSRAVVNGLKEPVWLAGGLNPDNVRQAIKTVRPFGVDVNSGVKGISGFKDPVKLKIFIEKVKSF